MVLSLVAALSLAADIDRVTTTQAPASSSSPSVTVAPSPTLVWVTIGTALVDVMVTTGASAFESTSTSYNVVQTPYTQSFSQPYSTLYTPKSGTIGLGTIKGTVGTVRPDRVVAVTGS
ncbi:hypothetical protein TRVA0_044S01002 [Trichomonascus vanleenenianus]|uniref:uncharacterized protein n=1 Tax=Trichomonascus vanleenenianus TaxID=2268995 RepID=UPI003ECB4948